MLLAPYTSHSLALSWTELAADSFRETLRLLLQSDRKLDGLVVALNTAFAYRNLRRWISSESFIQAMEYIRMSKPKSDLPTLNFSLLYSIQLLAGNVSARIIKSQCVFFLPLTS